MAEVQKNQAETENKLQIEQGKSQFEIQKIQAEAEIKKQLMELQFQYDMQLKQLEVQQAQTKNQDAENRKDNRTKMQATQQSQMINQRNNNLLPTNFEANANTEQPPQDMGEQEAII